MIKRTYFSWLCLYALSLFVTALCSCSPAPKGCVVKGNVKTEGYEGQTVYLCNPYTLEARDSASVRDGKFSFSPGGQTPDILLLKLKSSPDDLFPVTLPVVTENGTVEVVLGEIVLTSGTPLNDKLQDFLLAVDRFSDEMTKSGKETDKVRTEFMHLLETSILQNTDNPVGGYIFRAYSSRLTPECKAVIMDKAGEEFRKEIEQE